MPPRKPKQPKKVKASPEAPPQPVKRVFCEVARISKHLVCSICQEVFNDPQQPPCQHTFCLGCVQKWTENHRAATVPCPVCRTSFRTKDLRKNLLAFQLINELEMFCCNRGCEWRGSLEQISNHLPECIFGRGQLPEWYMRYLASREEDLEKQD